MTQKTNTTLLICLAFVFSLFFVNLSLHASSNKSQTNNLLGKYFSTLEKGRRNAEANIQSNVIMDYTEVEACEEDSDNEKNLIKAELPVTLSIFFSFVKQLKLVTKLNCPLDLIKCNLYPKKYLSLSILRI